MDNCLPSPPPPSRIEIIEDDEFATVSEAGANTNNSTSSNVMESSTSWTEHEDPSSSKYYYNSVTKESTYYTKPACFLVDNTNNSTSSNVTESSTSWTEHDAPSGSEYYYNSVTKESTYYTKPACFLVDKINGETNQPTSDKWKEYTDTETLNRKQKDTKGTSSQKHRGGDNITMSKATATATATATTTTTATRSKKRKQEKSIERPRRSSRLKRQPDQSYVDKSDSEVDDESELEDCEPHEEEIPTNWRSRFEELCAYKRSNGHVDVPTHSTGSLGFWVQNQRREYKKFQKNEQTAMNEKRINMLNSIGFQWKLEVGGKKDEETWNERFNELKAYKKLHGRTNVSMYDENNKKLGLWVVRQRKYYRKFIKGITKDCHLDEKRIEMLNSIGFEWEVCPARAPRS